MFQPLEVESTEVCLPNITWTVWLLLLITFVSITTSKAITLHFVGGYNHWTGLLDSPNCKIQLIQCRTEAKRTYSLSNSVFPGVSRGQRSRTYFKNEHSTMSFSLRQAYMLEDAPSNIYASATPAFNKGSRLISLK